MNRHDIHRLNGAEFAIILTATDRERTEQMNDVYEQSNIPNTGPLLQAMMNEKGVSRHGATPRHGRTSR